ncbi:hypothetical protein WN944_005804 [Citrus x changshan-huyou]|uniref:DUF569 domain-containing protein n=1 Tax=Citrus x changshan-huyou TaxID=2935761 RepID=A0AAP0MK35_9ROSI
MVSRVSSEQRHVFLKSSHGRYLTASDIPLLLGVTGNKVVSFPEYLSSVSSFGSVSDVVSQVLSDGASGSGPESPLSVVSPIKRSGFIQFTNTVLSLVRNLLTYLVLEATSFVALKLQNCPHSVILPKCPYRSTVTGIWSTLAGKLKPESSNHVEFNGTGGELQHAATTPESTSAAVNSNNRPTEKK